MKQKLFFLISVTLIVPATFLGGYLYFNNWSLNQSGVYGQLKPLVSTTLNDRKFAKSASVAAVRIEDKILGAKVILPVTVTITSKGNDWLVLINKKIRLSADFIPSDLVSLSELNAPAGALLRAQAYSALKEMFASAKSVGLDLAVVSAYRSYQQQIAVFNSWVALSGLKSAENFSAKAGFSQHQLGTAVDIGAPGKNTFSSDFGTSSEGIWLEQNAYKFGFVLSYPKGKEAVTGYSYEPWHFRYIGVENAQNMIKANLILEEYLQKFGTW